MTKTIETQTEKYFNEYTRNARTALAWVYPTEFRAILEKAIDLQVEAGKYLTKTATESVSKLVPDSVAK